MKEIVIISGKGGTGKTSIIASFAALAEKKVLADCDVDAADLHLILEPDIKTRKEFSGGNAAWIDPDACTHCDRCRELCRFDAIGEDHVVDPINCEGCAVCHFGCPEEAIEMKPCVNGEWFISDTRHGPMVHARLGIAEENSGKLVSLVRGKAKIIAEERGLDIILVDGSPGIGCPVIASITGSDMVLIVTEPTMSGVHDLKRVAGLAKHFNIPAAVCVNKADINVDIADQIEEFCEKNGLKMMERIDYDPAFTMAQVEGKSVVEYTDSKVSAQVKRLWESVNAMLN